ncbi:MAG: hypothetical protein ACM3SV_06005 [Betaproteobacteria bacterium]
MAVVYTDSPEAKGIEQKGTYSVNQRHELDGLLQKSIEAFEAAASRFATDCIKDANVRQAYMTNIKRISREVIAEVERGAITVKEGAEFCHQMRNKIMEEARVVTSAQGRSFAESLKKEGKTLENLLDAYSKKLFKRPFSALSEVEKNKVYYSVIESAGRDRASVTVATKRLRVIGKVGLLVTATLAVHSVAIADNKPKEAVRQGAIIGGGLAGGWLAGLAVSAICGPGAPICAVAVVLVGGIAGGLAAESAVDAFDDELEEFTRWQMR